MQAWLGQEDELLRCGTHMTDMLVMAAVGKPPSSFPQDCLNIVMPWQLVRTRVCNIRGKDIVTFTVFTWSHRSNLDSLWKGL